MTSIFDTHEHDYRLYWASSKNIMLNKISNSQIINELKIQTDEKIIFSGIFTTFFYY